MIDLQRFTAGIGVFLREHHIAVYKETVTLMDDIFRSNCCDFTGAVLNISKFKLLMPVPWDYEVCQISFM